MNYIDAHIHLEQYSEREIIGHLNAARAAGVTHIVAVSMDLPSSKRTGSLSGKFKDIVIPAYGFHPEQALLSQHEEKELIEWIQHRAAQGEWFAIGEVGLPYYKAIEAAEQGHPFDKKPYIHLLEKFILLAKELNRPIVLHAVYEDAAIACDLLQKHGVNCAHFHWFKGDETTINRMIQQEHYISITPDVLYEHDIQSLVKVYPLQLMMIETDGPWPFEGEFLNKQTQSAMVVRVAEVIANLKELPLAQVTRQLYNNSKAFYSI